MSGGHFDYDQYKIRNISDTIDTIIRNNHKKVDDYSYNYNDNTIKEFKKAIEYLKKAEIYTQRIDWLVSGDDGEETFHKRLKEDLDK